MLPTAYLRIVVLSGICCVAAVSKANEKTGSNDQTSAKRTTVPRLNLKMKTLGGKQFWSDVFWLHGWRIQCNAVSQHYRLLDSRNARRAWGTYEECEAAFEELRKSAPQTDAFPKMGRTVVVLLHGLGRSHDAMRKLATFLREQQNGWNVASLSYASGRLSIDEHAANLQRVLSSLEQEGVQEIYFVAHSLGNLVIRRYLGIQQTNDSKKVPAPEIKRIVMLGPPNQGSKMASMLKRNPLFRMLAGKSGQQIASLSELKKEFPTPSCEFAIIAGGRGKEAGRNPVLDGDDDLVVSVEETKLPGARDFLVVPSLHTFIMNDSKAQQATLSFLEHGYFVSEEERKPIE